MHRSPPAAKRADARDAALRRLRRTTAVVLLGAGAVAAGVADVAARAVPGRSTRPSVAKTTQATPTSRVRQTPPALVPIEQAAPTPPASAPVQSSAPPVASSGGT